MTGPAAPRPRSRPPRYRAGHHAGRRAALPLLAGLLLAGGGLAGLELRADPAAAQGVALGSFAGPSVGFAPLPVFARPGPAGDPVGDEGSRWAGSYARVSTGFEAVSSRRFGGYAGPTFGFEGGRMWQDGPFVYGISGGFDYLAALGGATPGPGRLAYSRDLAGGVQAKAGVLLTPDVLLYGKLGATALHETLRVGPRVFAPTAFAPAYSRDDLAVLPDARVGVEWAITDRLSVSVEAGATGRAFR